MKKDLDYIIESVVKGVILEYGGVSNDILDISNVIFDKIYKEHRDYPRKPQTYIMPPFNGHPLMRKRFYLCIDSLDLAKIVNEICVDLYFYDSNDESYDTLYNFLNENGFVSNNFSPRKKEIRFTFPWPNDDKLGNDAKTHILSTINHEVKHAYQDAQRNGTVIPDQYKRAQGELSKPFGKNKEADTPCKELVDYYVPWIYYKIDIGEIDAWMQEMYIEAQNTNDIKKTKTYKKLVRTIKDYEDLKYWYSTKDTYYTSQRIKDYIDKSIRRIDDPIKYFALCDRNIAYLKKKMMRVIGRWNEEQGTARGSFKQYARNEIPQEYAFRLKKTNPSLWRKLMQRFKFR